MIHLSCHGETTKEKSYLLFEKSKTGEPDQFTNESINKALDKTEKYEIDLVFVAACKSEFSQQAFIQFGAKHVIVVNSKDSVNDNVAIDFTKHFYEELLLHRKSICEAFNYAKDYCK